MNKEKLNINGGKYANIDFLESNKVRKSAKAVLEKSSLKKNEEKIIKY